ncbi:MAG: hypothetical protein WA962_12545 [Ornithinimicrobium sp.]
MPSVARFLTTAALLCAAGVGGVFGARFVADNLSDPTCEFTAAERSETMSPEQSANASTIALVAVQRGLVPRAASIAIATAIQESKLENINYGDADSLGLFQQRPSQGWGTEEEILNPVFATNAFYDALVQVEGWQDGVITEVAQTVQRSAYPEAYADHEWQGRVLASALTGQAPAAIGCDLDAPDGAGDAAAVAEELTALGFDARASADTVTVAAGDQATGWALASWGVAHAEGRQVTSVQVAGQSWSRAQDPMSWTDDATTGTGSTVVVTVAQ